MPYSVTIQMFPEAVHPRRLASCRSLVVFAAAGLQPWQLSKLKQAASQGRRNVKVEKLCKEVDLPRSTVLDYLKNAPAEPNMSTTEVQDTASDDGQFNNGWSARSAGGGSTVQPQRKLKQREADGQSGMPAWKRRARGGKSIGRQAEATLEMVYRRTAWPSDDVIDGLWDLHKIRKDQVIQWFQNKRREDRDGGRRKPQTEQGTGLDWFDQ